MTKMAKKILRSFPVPAKIFFPFPLPPPTKFAFKPMNGGVQNAQNKAKGTVVGAKRAAEMEQSEHQSFRHFCCACCGRKGRRIVKRRTEKMVRGQMAKLSTNSRRTIENNYEETFLWDGKCDHRRCSPASSLSHCCLSQQHCPASNSSSSSTTTSISDNNSNSRRRRSSSPAPPPLTVAVASVDRLQRRRNADAGRTVSSYCRMLTENTTFHGIRDTVQTAGHLRVLWLVILVLATFAALVGCALIVWEYNTRPLVVTYGIKEDVNLTLPDIVVCPFNRFNRSFLLAHNVSAPLAQYLELAFPSPAQHPFQYELYTKMIDQRRMDQMETEMDTLLANIGRKRTAPKGENGTVAVANDTPLSFTEFVKQSAIACQAFFADPRTCETAEEIMTSAGKCFRIRGVEQRSDGFGHGQRIILRLPKKLYNPGVNQMLNDGVVVKLAERGKGIDHDMSFVPSGVHAIFPLTATRYEFKNYPPHFECRDDDHNGAYSRVWCFEDCFMSQAERDCNCSLAAASRPTTPFICTTSQFFRCVYPKLYRKGFEERIARCKSHCGPPCNYWRFDKTVTYSHFPSEQAKHFVNDSSKWEELRSTIILDVYYITLDYTIIRHMLSMTPPSFVAQLGGQISLWIGGSIISVIQLVIYLSSAFCVYLRQGATKRRRRTTTLTVDESDEGNETDHNGGQSAKRGQWKTAERERRGKRQKSGGKTNGTKKKCCCRHNTTTSSRSEMILMSARV